MPGHHWAAPQAGAGRRIPLAAGLTGMDGNAEHSNGHMAGQPRRSPRPATSPPSVSPSLPDPTASPSPSQHTATAGTSMARIPLPSPGQVPPPHIHHPPCPATSTSMSPPHQHAAAPHTMQRIPLADGLAKLLGEPEGSNGLCSPHPTGLPPRTTPPHTGTCTSAEPGRCPPHCITHLLGINNPHCQPWATRQ